MPYKLRPSGAGKWYHCPGSVVAEEGLPEGDMSAANEGTVAHWIAARIFNGQVPPAFGTEFEVVEGRVLEVLFECEKPTIFTQEMHDHVKEYTDTVKRGCNSELHIEEGVQIFGHGEPKHGTPDCFHFDVEKKVLYVHDLKYGFSEVQAAGNLQLLLYAYGAANSYPACFVETVVLTIHQPRLRRVDSCTYTWADFKERVVGIMQQAKLAELGSEYRVAGEHCSKYYCKARGDCATLNAYVLADFPDGEEVLNSDIGGKLAKLDAIRRWCDDIEARAYRMAVIDGKSIAGYKVVQGREGSRKWADAREVEEAMKAMKLKHDVMYERSIISPTAAEKCFKAGDIGPKNWPKLQSMITRAEGKLQLVPEADKRPAVKSSVADFESLI